jgi:hypothetical protein
MINTVLMNTSVNKTKRDRITVEFSCFILIVHQCTWERIDNKNHEFTNVMKSNATTSKKKCLCLTCFSRYVYVDRRHIYPSIWSFALKRLGRKRGRRAGTVENFWCFNSDNKSSIKPCFAGNLLSLGFVSRFCTNTVRVVLIDASRFFLSYAHNHVNRSS